MKKTFRLIFFLLCMTFCSCTVYVDTLTHAYSAKDSKDVPLSDLSIIEPYTDISTFKTRFWEREHSDSLTLLAHEALLEVLDKDKDWDFCEQCRNDHHTAWTTGAAHPPRLP